MVTTSPDICLRGLDQAARALLVAEGRPCRIEGQARRSRRPRRMDDGIRSACSGAGQSQAEAEYLQPLLGEVQVIGSPETQPFIQPPCNLHRLRRVEYDLAMAPVARKVDARFGQRLPDTHVAKRRIHAKKVDTGGIFDLCRRAAGSVAGHVAK